MVYVFYARRVVDLLARYGRGAWRLFRREKEMTEDANDDVKENVLRDWMR
jgi:hypothetical protein